MHVTVDLLPLACGDVDDELKMTHVWVFKMCDKKQYLGRNNIRSLNTLHDGSHMQNYGGVAALRVSASTLFETRIVLALIYVRVFTTI